MYYSTCGLLALVAVTVFHYSMVGYEASGLDTQGKIVH